MATTYDGELVGGHPALDFLNTIHDWTVDAPRDCFGDFGDAVRFGEAVGLLSPGEGRFLLNARAGAELSRLRKLRSTLERVFRALVRADSVPSADLDDLAAVGIEVARAVKYRGTAAAPLQREIVGKAAGAALLRLRVADTAMALLNSAEIERIKECPACGWFFIDSSKNQSRRWCSMTSCGASAKSKAYYRRQNPALP